MLFFFLMGWVAALTILVQGSTTGLLLQVLGMTRTPTVKKTFLEHVLRQVEDAGEAHASKQPADTLLGPPRWDVVRSGLGTIAMTLRCCVWLVTHQMSFPGGGLQPADPGAGDAARHPQPGESARGQRGGGQHQEHHGPPGSCTVARHRRPAL